MLKINFDDGYVTTFTKAYPIMRELGLKGICYIIVNKIGKQNFMSQSQLQKLVIEGWQIGSHTLNHPDLTAISLDQAEYEIKNSKEALEELGYQVDSFAYPFGRYNEDIIKIVKKYYKWARACYKNDGTQWTKTSHNLVHDFKKIDFYVSFSLVHSIDQPLYRSN